MNEPIGSLDVKITGNNASLKKCLKDCRHDIKRTAKCAKKAFKMLKKLAKWKRKNK